MIAETLDLVVHLHLDQRSGTRRVVHALLVSTLLELGLLFLLAR